jgi:hypothetical protein
MVALCSPRPKRDVQFIGIDVNVRDTLDDVKIDVWAAPVCGCIVLILGVIPAVIGVCVMAGIGVSVTLSSTLLGSMNKVLPEVILIGVLLVDVEAAVPADPLCD